MKRENITVLKYSDLVEKLKEIKSKGYVKTHRAGNTGIGKTLEDLLGIEENNIPGPDAEMIELKSARKNTKTLLTLFTKSPMPSRANFFLLQRFGYPSRRGNNRKELHTMVNALSYNTLKGKETFKIQVKEDRIEIISKSLGKSGLSYFVETKKIPGIEILGYWDKETLKHCFERKLPRLMYVKADFRGSGDTEEFLFNEAWLLSGFDFENFIRLIKDGDIVIDIRIGQYPDGRPHDHGTGFRVSPDKLDMCFTHREKII